MVIHHFTRATRHLLFWSLIAAALALTAVRVFLVDIVDYKTELEQKIRQTTHIPIRIGKLSASMRGFHPGIALQNITVDTADAGAKPAIELKEVRLGIDLLQLLLTGDPLSASRVTLVGAKIAVVRNLDGSIAVKGLQSGDEQPLWLLHGDKYEILQSDVSWQDLKNQGKQVMFRNIDLVLKNHYLDQSHEIHLLTTLPKQYGDSLRISALIRGNVFEANDIDGQLYIEGVNLQGPALSNGDLPLGLKIESGSGDVRVWSQWQNSSPIHIAGYIQAQQIKIASQEGNTLQLDTMEGNVSWLKKESGWRIGAYDVDMVANRQRWADGEFYLQQDNQGGWSGSIKQLNLQALAHIAPLFITADHPYRDWLRLNPSGKLNDFSFYAQAGLQHYALQGRFSQLGNDAANSIPRLRGVTGRISGSDSLGRIEFASEDILIDAPDLFRNSLTVKRLNGGIQWRQQAESWLLSSRDLAIDSPDFQTETDFDLTLPKNKAAASLDMLTRFGHFVDVSRLPVYFPAKLMDKDAVKWMDQAFIAGQINQGELVIRGNLDQFPFDKGQGLFEAVFSVENGELQYNPDWPRVRDLNADLHYLGQDLRVAITSGHSENVSLKQMLVTINSLPISEYAALNGQVQSNLQNALLFLQKTPLHTQVDPLLKLVTLDSNTQVDLDLVIPYHENMRFGVNVAAHIDNARLTFKPVDLTVDHINGVLNFTEDSISSERLTAMALGFPIKGALSTDNTATRLQIEGYTSADELQRQFTFLHNDMTSGIFPYQAELTVPLAANQAQTLIIDSNLLGLAINNQDFLSKTAEEQRLLRLNFQFENKAMLPLQVHYGSELNAALLIDTEQNHLHSGHVVLGRHEADTIQQAGLSVEINQPEFKVSQALGALSDSDSRWPALRELTLETDQLVWQGQNLGATQCHFQHINQAWQGDIDNAMAKGRLIIPDQRSGSEPIKLDMDYLNLSAMSSLNFNTAAEEVVTVLPLIDIDSQQLLWRSVNLGKLKLQTERLINGVHFKKIKLSGSNKDINFTADWIKQLHGTATQISGSLSVDNFGQFLAELGYSDDFKETHADISFSGVWNDAPQRFSLERLNGQLQVKLSDGRISSIEPGFGRLLGLIAMEQWAKRLSLDFSDVYRQGLAFDKITGNFKITDGVAYTDDLLIDAVAAKMRIAGTANLLDKTLDNRVIVLPKSSDALPIAGTIVGGIAEIITSAVTGDYKEGYFFGSEYKIAGRWGNVEVTPVNDHEGLVNKTWHGLTDFGWLK